MNEKKLLKAIGQIEEDFIMEAKDNNQKVRKLHFRKIAAIAIAATMTLGIGTWAASSIVASTSGHSSSVADFKDLPTAEQINKLVGTQISLPKEFANGYKFDEGRKVESKNHGENGEVIENYTSLSTTYKKDGDKVILSVDPLNLGNQENYGTLLSTHNNSNIYGDGYTAKFVPGDYELTEQDKQDEASGKYVFSYGSSKIEIQEIQGLNWKDDGVVYSITAIDSKLSQDELVEIAKEMIDFQ